MTGTTDSRNESRTDVKRRRAEICARIHIAVGWWSLLIFLVLGIVLETMHGFKIGWYLDVDNENRRLMWTLAHAHGTLLSLVHIAFAWTASTVVGWHKRWRGIASRCLLVGGALVPLGFFLGGVFAVSADPGLGILLVPPGAVLLLLAVLITALASRGVRL